MEEEVVLYKARHAYLPENSDEISLKKGDILRLINKVDGFWWEGESLKSKGNVRGWFPSNYVRELKPSEIEKFKKEKKANMLKESTPFDEQNSNKVSLKFRQTVTEEIMQTTNQFIADIKFIIQEIRLQLSSQFDSYYNISKLIKSLIGIRTIEEKINDLTLSQYNINRSNAKIGLIYLEHMEKLKQAYALYFSIHPCTVDFLRKEADKIQLLDDVRSYLAKPLIRLEQIPLKLRDLEKFYGDSDEDRLELGRAIYQVETILHKCLEIRKQKDLELSLLQQPIRNWSGEPIDKLGTMRLMIQLNIRAGRDQRQISGFGLVFPNSVILITATERMSGFVLITHLPTNNASACRHNDKTIELTGQSGHFWLDFEKAPETDEWWAAMQSLSIAKNRNSFVPYVASDKTSAVKDEDSDVTVTHASFSKHVPVKQLVNKKSSVHQSSLSPEFKSLHSISAITSQGSSIFCPRPTPPCYNQQVLSPQNSGKTKDSKRRPRSRARNLTPDNELNDVSKSRIQKSNAEVEDETDVLNIFNYYDDSKQRKISDSNAKHTLPKSISTNLSNDSFDMFISPIKAEVQELKDKILKMEELMVTEKAKVRNIRAKLDDETKARKQLEIHIIKWQQNHDEYQKE